jgi:hypothetical protein
MNIPCDVDWPEDPLPIPSTRSRTDDVEPVAHVSHRHVRPPKRTPIPIGRLRALNKLLTVARAGKCRCRSGMCLKCQADAIVARWPMSKKK